MAVDRRGVLGLAFTALMVGCAGPGEGREPVTDQFWRLFRDAFIDASGRVVDTGNGGISHSEGQGYGLLMAAIAGDRATFERLIDWTEAHLAASETGLFIWKYDPHAPDPLADRNNATDGDILIAWALDRAAARWRNAGWAARAAEIRRAIRRHLVIRHQSRTLLLPAMHGFLGDDALVLNPSYFIWPALDSFAQSDGDGGWDAVIGDCQTVLGQARFGAHGLPCDWIEIGRDGAVSPARGRPPRFGYDAVRIALYAMAGRRTALAAPIAAFWQAEGDHPPAWIDVISGERAGWALPAGGMAIARRLLGQRPVPQAIDTDYYSAALQVLAGAL